MAQYLKSRTTYSFAVFTLSYAALAISTVIEHAAPEMPTLVPYTLLVALSLQLIGIMVLPSYFTTTVRCGAYYLINLGALTLTLVLSAYSIYFLIIEILFLLIFYTISYRAYQSIRISFDDVVITPEEYLESVTFNLMRLNIIQIALNLAALFIIVLLPDFSTALYILAVVSSILIQLRLHFKQRIKCSNPAIAALSIVSSLGSLSFAYFVRLSDDYIHALLTIIIFMPYVVITYLLNKEYRSYLRKYRYFSS